MVGKTLGHYQISFQLGKGGMGEVYQAKDRYYSHRMIRYREALWQQKAA